MKSILDRSFVYVPAIKTDLRKTFARIREQMAMQQQTVRVVKIVPFKPK